MSSPHAADAHLSALALDAALLGEPLPAAAEAHLQTCDACRARLGEIRAFDAGLDLRPPTIAPSPAVDRPDAAEIPAGSNVVSLDAVRRRRMRWLSGAGAVMALAAALLLMLRSGPSPEPAGGLELDTLRVRGGETLSAFDVAFFVHDGAAGPGAVRRVGSGDAVAPGERLRFRLTLPGHAFVTIVGVDAEGTTYRCHPQGVGDELAEHHGAGAPSAATEVEVPDTVAFDDAGGAERIVAVACETPQSLHAIETALAQAVDRDPLPTLAPGCVQRELRLQKSGPAAVDGGP